MDSEPHLGNKPSSPNRLESLRLGQEGEKQLPEEEDPYSLNGPSISLLGLVIAFVMLVIPFFAVLTDRPSSKESFVPTALEQNGSQSFTSIPFTRFS